MTATVIEQGTDLEANATWSTQVKVQKVVMDIASMSSNTFKTGLPYYGTMKMRMEGADQMAFNGTLVDICIQVTNSNRPKRRFSQQPSRPRLSRQRNASASKKDTSGQRVCSQYLSDDQGLVHFQFLPNDLGAVEYTIKVWLY